MEAAALIIVVAAGLSIVAITRLPALPPALTQHEPFMASVVGGLTHLVRTPRLRASTVTTTLVMGASGVLLIALPLHMAAVGMPRSAVGYLWTALEIGSVATALLLGRLQTRWRPEYVIVAAAAGLVATTWPLATSFVVLLLLRGHHRTVRGADAAGHVRRPSGYSPESLQGRVSTTAASLIGASALAQAIGLLVPTRHPQGPTHRRP